jgi:hypothetical protein
MRPVTKGAVVLAQYPMDLPVNSVNAFRNAARGYTLWNFNTQAVFDLWKTWSPTAWDLVDGLRELSEFTGKKRPKRIVDLQDAKSAVERQLSETPNGYKQAAGLLTNRVGKICSYCEQFLPDDADIEHCIPKAEYPWFRIAWSNFLFACGACNGSGSGKGVGPDRATVKGWQGTPNNPTEIQFYQAMRDWYLWPDTDSTSYQFLTPYLAYLDTGSNTWEQVPDADSIGPNVALLHNLLKPKAREVYATLSIGAGLPQTYEVAVSYDPTRQAATDSIPYFGLDRTGLESPSIRDFRQYNRTIEWLVAVRMMRRLANANAANFNNELLDLANSVTGRGNFSVWVRIVTLMIGDATPVPGGGGQTIMDAFLQAVNVQGIWPGTNLADVP